MRTNTKPKLPPIRTHEGAPAVHINAEAQLRRSVMSCLLFENEFYEDGVEISKRIDDLVSKVKPGIVKHIAYEARHVQNLRHVPLWLARSLTKHAQGTIVGDTILSVIQRADEMGEFLALYMKGNKDQPLDYQVKRALRQAFSKFDAYQLGKYNRDGEFKLRDILRLVHPKPKNVEQSALWKKVIDGTLESPDTWEVALSGGADKKETFTRLITENKLGYFALLRNLRNMVQAGVDRDLIIGALQARKGGAEKVLPFRYVAAARAVPQLEPAIDDALRAAIKDLEQLSGVTTVLVDVSGSMEVKLSAKSDLTRMDAAAALASIIHGHCRVYTFSNSLVEIPPRKGMAGVDAIVKSQPHGGTNLGAALQELNTRATDRLIVITDEQSHDKVPVPGFERAYMINVASAKNGVGYHNGWVHVDGFSESVLRYIHEYERSRD